MWGWTSSRNQSIMINFINLVYPEVTLIRLVARCSDVDSHKLLIFSFTSMTISVQISSKWIRSMELCVCCWLYSLYCKFEALTLSKITWSWSFEKVPFSFMIWTLGTCSFYIAIRRKSEAITLMKAQVWYKCFENFLSWDNISTFEFDTSLCVTCWLFI